MSKLLTMLMSGGKKVEFKEYIYSSGGAYISLPLFQDIRFIKVKANCTGTTNNQFYGFLRFYYNNSLANYISVGIRKITNAPYWQTCYLLNGSIKSAEDANSSLFEKTYDIGTSKNSTNSCICVGNNGYDGKNGQTYYIEIYNSNNENICSLYPAVVNEESGLYDKTNNIFYGNSNSSGSLICV